MEGLLFLGIVLARDPQLSIDHLCKTADAPVHTLYQLKTARCYFLASLQYNLQYPRKCVLDGALGYCRLCGATFSRKGESTWCLSE